MSDGHLDSGDEHEAYQTSHLYVTESEDDTLEDFYPAIRDLDTAYYDDDDDDEDDVEDEAEDEAEGEAEDDNESEREYEGLEDVEDDDQVYGTLIS
jgi:hypothetical protein